MFSHDTSPQDTGYPGPELEIKQWSSMCSGLWTPPSCLTRQARLHVGRQGPVHVWKGNPSSQSMQQTVWSGSTKAQWPVGKSLGPVLITRKENGNAIRSTNHSRYKAVLGSACSLSHYSLPLPYTTPPQKKCVCPFQSTGTQNSDLLVLQIKCLCPPKNSYVDP